MMITHAEFFNAAAECLVHPASLVHLTHFDKVFDAFLISIRLSPSPPPQWIVVSLEFIFN